MATAHKMTTARKATRRVTAKRPVARKAHRPAVRASKPVARKPAPQSGGMEWRRIATLVKGKWESITDADLKFVDRSMEALINKVRERTGLERDTAERQLDELIGTLTLLPSEVVRPAPKVKK